MAGFEVTLYGRIWVTPKGNGGQVWECSVCDWARPYPRLVSSGQDSKAELQQAFENHKCKDFPRTKKRREDVNQAAARVVREATENR